MNEFWQTILIATIPSVLTAIISYLAASKNANTQIKAIREQNKADIESLKERYRLDMEAKEKEYQHQIDVIKLQHENELKKDKDAAINQIASNALGNLVGSIFTQDSPMSGLINEAMKKSFSEHMTKQEGK